jgi:dCTP deaminase
VILSAQSIRNREGMIIPFHGRTRIHGMTFGLSMAGYDIRADGNHPLEPQGFIVISSVEQFNMPLDILGRVADKSTWARQGLAVQNTVIEPGWRGFLNLELTNHSQVHLYINDGMPIAQVIFEMLDEPTLLGYEGKYQDQKQTDIGPVYDK